MTQQTTAERIRDFLERTVGWDANRGDMEGHEEATQLIAAEIDDYIDTIAQLSARCDTIAFHAQTLETALIAAAAERDEALAEIARLRPAAEAWEAREAFMNQRLPGKGIEGENVDAWNLESRRLNVLLNAANDRARAAKGDAT